MARCPQFGRYRGESGHGGYERRLPSLTHSDRLLIRFAATQQRATFPTCQCSIIDLGGGVLCIGMYCSGVKSDDGF
jgi:hypothetical protein